MILPYVLETIDPLTGKVVSFDLGVSMTVSEFTDTMSVPMRLGRTVLVEMGLLQLDGGRLRLKPEHQAAGLGMRLRKKGTRFPFDVLSPAGQTWAKERWSSATASIEARRAVASPTVREASAALQKFCELRGIAPMATQLLVCWLLDHFPTLTVIEIADILSATESAVKRWSARRSTQRTAAYALKAKREFPRYTHEEVLRNRFRRYAEDGGRP